MLQAYFNQPNPHVTIHTNMGCGQVKRQGHKATRREININILNLKHEMSKFEKREIPFAAVAGLNGLWVTVNLGNLETEEKVIREIIYHLGLRYKAFRDCEPGKHC